MSRMRAAMMGLVTVLAVVAVGAGNASATTYEVSTKAKEGKFEFTAGETSWVDGSLTMTCAESSVSGDMKEAKEVLGTEIGEVLKAIWNKEEETCKTSGSIKFLFNVATFTSEKTWRIEAVGLSKAGDLIEIIAHEMRVKVTSGGCHYEIKGNVPAIWHNESQTLSFSESIDKEASEGGWGKNELEVVNAECLEAVKNGDKPYFAGSYKAKSGADVLIDKPASGGGGSKVPLFVSKSGTYPQAGTYSGGLVKVNTTSGHEVDCSSLLGNFSLGLRLALFLFLYHKCTTTLLFSSAECNSAGEPKGLIHAHVHAWLGYLTDAAGEKMVGLLVQPEEDGIDALFECEANALENAHITVLGEAVAAIPAAEINRLQKSLKIAFSQSSAGVQSPQTFLLPSPLSLMTGIKTTMDITGSISEKPEVAQVMEGTLNLSGTEEGEIQG